MDANFEINQIEIAQTMSSVLREAQALDFAQTQMSDRQRRQQWRGAIAALEQLLQTQEAQTAGIVLSSPSPMFCDRQISEAYQQVVFAPKSLKEVALQTLQLTGISDDCAKKTKHNFLEFPLFPNDPLHEERFCLILTPKFSFVMVASKADGFQFSFDPNILHKLWSLLQWRMALTQPFQFKTIKQLWQQFSPVAPDYKIVSRFSQVMLRSQPDLPDINVVTQATKPKSPPEKATTCRDIQPELELLQALTHEIRTPLTTIRTMTKLLLKKKSKLTKDIVKRIETIEQECNEQIRRMELIFRAAELETPSRCRKVQLIPISLDQIFQHGIPFWEKQAQRRNVNLQVIKPETLPQVVSDPAMLDQVLSGLIETFTRRSPSGSEIQIQVSTAGHQLKLEVQAHGIDQKCLEKAIGQLLIFQPETGSLSLNTNVTKNLFHALGGKLRIRQRPSGEDIFTIFLPLGNNVPLNF